MGDDRSFAVLEPVAEAKTQLRWFMQDGLAYDSVAPTAPVAPGPGTQLLALGGSQAFWPAGDRLMLAGKLQLRSELCATASGPIAALAPTEQGVYVLVGRAAERTWHVEYAAADQSQTTRIGSFERREEAPVAAAAARATLYFTCDATLYAARAS